MSRADTLARALAYSPLQKSVFTAAITCASRGLLLRDRLLGIPKAPHQSDTGVRWLRCTIPGAPNPLDAVFACPSDSMTRAAILICHGVGETVSHWRAVQTLLAEHGVASLVFDYAGYGRSRGSVDASQCERDAVSAFRWLKAHVTTAPVSLLGFSLGSGIAASIANEVAVSSLILCAAFTSFREAVRRVGSPRWLTPLFPNIWDTAEALETCTAPVLIVHGERDRLFPVAMARALANSGHGRCELIIVPGLRHNEPIYKPTQSYWARIAEKAASSRPPSAR